LKMGRGWIDMAGDTEIELSEGNNLIEAESK
jgi:hypothetical protein